MTRRSAGRWSGGAGILLRRIAPPARASRALFTAEGLRGCGYHYTALKDTMFMDPRVIADTALYLNSDLAASLLTR
jgi:hypothetical protein